MDQGKSKASEFERRASMRHSRRISIHGGERDGVLDDRETDSDLTALDVADGFRPQELQRRQHPQGRSSPSSYVNRPTPSVSSAASSSTPDLRSSTSTAENARPLASSDAVETSETTTNSQQTASPPERPLSIAKHPRPTDDSLSQRHDAANGPPQGISVLSREPTGSSISEPYFGQETPYRGPAGPSHPYGMYTQNVRATRTGSVATTSTGLMSESSFGVSRGPAHPYGMYPQATVDETSAMPAASIPVGFPGMAGTQYQRRLGPDGEEIADIIGPDGHTEQLPPYTRYPDETYARKVRDAEQQPVPPAPAVGAAVVGPRLAAPRASIAGAGGIGLATRNPDFDPTDDDPDSPQSRHSSRSFATEASHHVINAAATDVALSEKQTPKKRAQRWGKRRLCGIVPYWAMCLAIVILVAMVIVLGAVVGTVLAKQHSYKRPPKKDGSYQYGGAPTVTVTYDATPIPTPTDLPELVTGTFSLPLMTNRVSNTCFNDTTQAQAWNCNVLIFTAMVMNIRKNNLNNTLGYSISINANQSLTLSNNVYSYGEQPFVIPDLTPMELVNDTFQPARGPAWFKLMPFDKTVIVPESLLTASPSAATPTPQVVARSFNNAFGSSPGDFKRKGIAQSGDRPWVCTWPRTFLEIFIYPQQNSSWNLVSPSGTTSGSSSSTTPAPGSPAPTGNGLGGNTGSGGFPSATTTVDKPSTSTGPYGPIDTSSWGPPPPPLYPRVMKIEERRIDRSPTPACRQVEVAGDGQPARPVKDANGNDVVIYIAENEPPPPGVQRANIHNSVLDYRDSSEISDCGCMWFIT